MKLIDSKVEIIEEANPLKKIEMAGRTCYKSEKNITDESAEKFVKNLIKHEHTAMLEHATFVFQVFDEDMFQYLRVGDMSPIRESRDPSKFFNFSYTTLVNTPPRMLVSGSLRAILETPMQEFYQYALWEAGYGNVCDDCWIDAFQREGSSKNFKDVIRLVDINDFFDLTIAEKQKHTYVTARFTCDRGVTHELVRHRLCGFAQESTRYCNYTKNQFGNELTFIKPAGWDEMTESQQEIYEDTHAFIENQYFDMIREGLLPQQARAILTNDIKTEIVVTTSLMEWQHIFNLRLFGTTGAPHPDIKLLFQKAYDQYFKDYIKKPNKDSEDK